MPEAMTTIMILRFKNETSNHAFGHAAYIYIYIYVTYTHIPQTVLALRGSYLASIAITSAFRYFAKIPPIVSSSLK